MCRLFGFRSNVESRAHHSLVVAENAMATQASHHSDGWGRGYFIDEDPYLFRTSKGAAQDDSFRRFSEGLRSNTLLVHIRKATVGAIDPINSHPSDMARGSLLTMEPFLVSIRSKNECGRDITYVSRVLFGNTDSETILLLLSAMVRRGCSADGTCDTSTETVVEAQQEAINQIFEWVKEMVSQMHPRSITF